MERGGAGVISSLARASPVGIIIIIIIIIAAGGSVGGCCGYNGRGLGWGPDTAEQGRWIQRAVRSRSIANPRSETADHVWEECGTVTVMRYGWATA